ncbi:MAG TPA: hypothetical protein VFU13_01135 [Steroidobacteraceae bacterium]|nr:hypothetical protein [Steroidobacteraceae bacterium]
MKKFSGMKICALVALLTCFTMHASAYNQGVHQVISEHAARRSVLYTGALLADWGYSDPLTATFPSYDFPALTMATMIGRGAYHEDDDSQIKRVFNHFTDAQVNPPFGRGLQAPLGAGDQGTIGHPSPLWALEDTHTVSSISAALVLSPAVVPQVYSYRDAQEHFFQALSSENPGIRVTRFGAMFQTLGHVVHHIQDMGQPQHPRNESHISEGILEDEAGSWYELYTSLKYPDENPQGLQALLANTPYNGGAIPTFSTAREFWSQPDVPGPHFRGMADFTARNYVGIGTNFRVNVASDGSVSFLGDPDQPLPNGINRDGTPVYLQRVTAPLTMYDGSVRSTSMRYVKGKVYDENISVIAERTQERILASESIFLPAFAAGPLDATMATNSVVFDDNYPVLLPRSSAFSSGLINHFFRGRLDLFRTTPTGTNWSILNAGTQAMNGQFYVYREDSAGTRILAAGPFARSVAVGATTVVSVPEPPSSTYRMIVAFRGQIGAEGDPSGSGFVAVAGKVVNFNPQTIPCGSSFSAAGSSEGNETFMELGSSAGPVRGEFEAYNIPDSLVVRRTNSSGPVLYTTGGQSPGFKEFNFQHPGGTDPATNRIWIKVTGNVDTATRWTAVISCPNGSISNSTRPQPRISISFSSTASGKTVGCGRGFFDFYLNDIFGAGTVTSVPWGGGQAGTSQSIMVTAGSNHFLRVVKRTTDPGSPYDIGCGQPSRPLMNLSFQQIDLSLYLNGGRTITIQ